MNVWHPRAVRVEPRKAASSSYVEGPWRQVLHTTELKSYSPSRESYYGHDSFPHATITAAAIHQHYPIDRAARALKNLPGGVETNRLRCVQAEIVWVAAECPAMPTELLDNVRDWVRWVQGETGHQLVAPQFFGADAGFIVASSTARQRMTPEVWKNFNGICGHQHVPENDHWDPGAINISYLLGTTERKRVPDMVLYWHQGAVYAAHGGWRDPQGLPGPVVDAYKEAGVPLLGRSGTDHPLHSLPVRQI